MEFKQGLIKEKMLLINRINEEMKAIANSPTKDVMKFRLGMLAKLSGELQILNDKITWKSCCLRKVA